MRNGDSTCCKCDEIMSCDVTCDVTDVTTFGTTILRCVIISIASSFCADENDSKTTKQPHSVTKAGITLTPWAFEWCPRWKEPTLPKEHLCLPMYQVCLNQLLPYPHLCIGSNHWTRRCCCCLLWPPGAIGLRANLCSGPPARPILLCPHLFIWVFTPPIPPQLPTLPAPNTVTPQLMAPQLMAPLEELIS